MDFTGLSDDDLVVLNQRLGVQVDDLRAQRVAINRELTRRDAERRVAQLLEGMSPDAVTILADAAVARASGQEATPAG